MQNAEKIRVRIKLWADPAQTAVRGETLRRLSALAGFTAKAMARELDVNRSTLYQEKVRIPQKIQQRLRELTRVIDNAFVLFEGDEKAVMEWLFSPSRRFYNMTPFSLVMGGNGSTVYEFQENLINDSETFKSI
ncbi:DUF2384 domain-containing protein [Oligoflexus tunisiensis]|uniref:DUF2384 domain-containing protein n=1 Tax=Oligoflexus tunisiensis TaxID=708132 RepID=UPI00114C9FB3|nr:DUF2384 domain-containing protein [Oligoflexus tunisiensis]